MNRMAVEAHKAEFRVFCVDCEKRATVHKEFRYPSMLGGFAMLVECHDTLRLIGVEAVHTFLVRESASVPSKPVIDLLWTNLLDIYKSDEEAQKEADDMQDRAEDLAEYVAAIRRVHKVKKKLKPPPGWFKYKEREP